MGSSVAAYVPELTFFRLQENGDMVAAKLNCKRKNQVHPPRGPGSEFAFFSAGKDTKRVATVSPEKSLSQKKNGRKNIANNSNYNNL